MRTTSLLLLLPFVIAVSGCEKSDAPVVVPTAGVPATSPDAAVANDLILPVAVKAPDLPGRELAKLYCHVEIMPNAQVGTVEGYSAAISETGEATVHIPGASLTKSPRDVIVSVDPSEQRPYEAQTKLQLDVTALQKPPMPITLNVTKVELKAIKVKLVDSATGKGVIGQPLALMEKSPGSAKQVNEATTDKDGRVEFVLWPNTDYEITPRLGGTVEVFSDSRKITEADRKSGSIEWRVINGKGSREH